MQFRFHELGARLYDFIDIVVLPAAIVVFLLIALTFRNTVLELSGGISRRMSSESEKGKRYMLYARSLVDSYFRIVLWWLGLVTLASFLVGMFKNIGRGDLMLQ